MNDQKTNIIPGAEPPVPTPPVPAPKVGPITRIFSKIPPKVKESFNKFYMNKKVFLPVSIAFGLLFLTIIIGILFGAGGKRRAVVPKTATPTPEGQENIIQENQKSPDSKLDSLKNQINSLDVNQKRLQPPAVNFKVNF